MKSAVYLTTRLFPDTDGGTHHDRGTCNFLAKLLDLHAFCYVDESENIDNLAEEAGKEPYAVHLYEEDESKCIGGIYAHMHLIKPVCRQMIKDIEDRIHQDAHTIVFYTLKMSLFVQKLCRKYPSVHYIYISHNTEYLNIRSDLERYDQRHNVTGWKHRFKIVRASFYEKQEGKCLRMAEQTFSISKADSGRLSEHFGVSPDHFTLCKPMIWFNKVRLSEEEREFSHKLLIVGNMSWFPTAQGVRWFAKKVYPSLRSTDPKLQLFIVGGGASEDIKNLESSENGIKVTGFVPSVDDYYRDCDIAIVPIFDGTGAKIKVLEALGKEIPCVISSYAVEDYEGLDAVLPCAEDAAGFIEILRNLLSTEADRLSLAEAEAAYYREYMKDNRPVREYIEGIK